ncbi:sRNA-binding protein [Variovorax boronicumulans]|uniref:SRNA-binding protein n=1 Tax=Variovorax boronicumulans TaxID=436515 RepID=A0AAW8DS14_9BURK|nr:ProQ/FINO family protein [Variovorax boronicumulans]MDP9877102.1 sRNA-binding protein [Variovorax boronicumulans]MDP9922021.1 sRNA-binding protein [Variovorax boronicumulans]
MTDASTAAPNTNSRNARRQRPDMAEQLQQLKAGAGTDAGADASATQPAPAQQQQQQRPPRAKQQRPHGQQQPQQGRKPRGPQQQQQQPEAQRAPRKVNPVLERLFELYPQLFGARFVPLKLGVYEELIARHPEDFKAEDLKIAMGQHARSTRYLESVAAGHARHDLDGNALDPVAPEHVHHAILELHRRRSHRNPGEDLRPQLVTRIAKAIEASGLDHEAYAVLVRSRDANNNAVVDEALAELAQQAAKREALLRAFEASGRSEQEFADMYGMKPGDVTRTLQRVRDDKKRTEAAAEAAAAAAAAAPEAVPEAAPQAAESAPTPASDEPAATGN